MTPGPANLIKTQIKAKLDELVAIGGTLGAVIQRDINVNILDEDGVIPAYPCAILGTSNMQADWEYPQTNRRIYQFDILIVEQQDRLTYPSQMEDLRDAIATKFDNNVTLGGAAPLGIAAVISDVMTYASKGRNLVIFNVTIKATTFQCLTYNFY